MSSSFECITCIARQGCSHAYEIHSTQMHVRRSLLLRYGHSVPAACRTLEHYPCHALLVQIATPTGTSPLILAAEDAKGEWCGEPSAKIHTDPFIVSQLRRARVHAL